MFGTYIIVYDLFYDCRGGGCVIRFNEVECNTILSCCTNYAPRYHYIYPTMLQSPVGLSTNLWSLFGVTNLSSILDHRNSL